MPNIVVTRQPVIQQLIENGEASLLEQNLCGEFCAYITKTYPWHVSGLRLDWERIPNSSRLPWSEVSDDDVESFIESTNLMRFQRVAVVYGELQPGLICSLEFTKKNIDLLTFNSTGLSYVVGMSDHQNQVLQKDAFIEIDGAYWISGFRQ